MSRGKTSPSNTTQEIKPNKILMFLGGALVGILVGTWVVGIGIFLSLTGIGAIIGIPMIIAGIVIMFVAPFQYMKTTILKGVCPYCGSSVSINASRKGKYCRACKKRIVIKDKKFIRVD